MKVEIVWFSIFMAAILKDYCGQAWKDYYLHWTWILPVQVTDQNILMIQNLADEFVVSTA